MTSTHDDSQQLDTPTSREKKISWDEATIAEHNKARGTREKILEPNTPYYLSASEHSSDSEPMSSQRLNNRDEFYSNTQYISQNDIMQEVSTRLNQLKQYKTASDSDFDDPISQSDQYFKVKKDSILDFKERRRMHYDEYRTLRNNNFSDTE